jgi:hypothetical protein
MHGCVSEPTAQEAAGLKSVRDFKSTAAILPTTVLSEALSLLLYSVVRGGLEFLGRLLFSGPDGLV